MSIVRFSTKGQLVVPKELREAYGWGPGVPVELVDEGDGVKLRPARVRKRYTLDDLYGVAQYDGPTKTLEDMQKGIDEAMAERWGRKGAKQSQ
jgi:AbrB family looped-hinge helix DNA binding protein